MATQLPQVTGTATKRPLDDLQDDCYSCDADQENTAKKLKRSPQPSEDTFSLSNENSLQTREQPNDGQNQQILEFNSTETSATLCNSQKNNTAEISAALCESLKVNTTETAKA